MNIEYLKQGKYDFVFDLENIYVENLINIIRNSVDKKEIINGFLSKAKFDLPYFCLDIIYDMEEYKEVVFELLNNDDVFNYFIKSVSKMSKILFTTEWGKIFILDNFERIVTINNDFLYTILNYVFYDFDNYINIIREFSLVSDLHLRYQIMIFIIDNYYDKFDIIYNNIIDYLHIDNQYMSNEDVSNLAISIYNSKLDRSLWIEIKNFIFSNYNYNYLASLLCEGDKFSKQEFILDADRLFESSLDYKIEIYKKYSQYISEDIMNKYIRYFNYFSNNGVIDNRLNNIIFYELFENLKEYIDKYLSISKTDCYKALGSGSTASCYKIGDYVFKLNNGKWSYEDVICPNLYLIIKNLEEDYIRNKDGYVVAGIEVQKYLTRNDKITNKNVKKFELELAKLGYYVSDTLINGSNGNNCMLLDSYKDADCENPDSLPQYFKEFPMVLIDRDLVFKIDNKKPKTLLGYRY